MRFIADESCDFGVVRALRAGGHEVMAVAEISPRIPDQRVLELAVNQNCVLITEDKDFGELIYAQRRQTGGVILLRFPGDARSAMVVSGTVPEELLRLHMLHQGPERAHGNGRTPSCGRTAPVLTLIAQLGGGKTHTLTALYHLVENHEYAKAICGDLRRALGVERLSEQSKVPVFVGNAWDPSETRETPWLFRTDPAGGGLRTAQ